MILNQCIIKNFRSIKLLIFDFRHKMHTLVGLNESDKFNILKALSLLHPDVEPINDDIRDPSHDEPPIESAFVRFVFTFEESELDCIETALLPIINCNNYTIPLFKIDCRDYNVKDFCRYHRQGLFTIDLIESKKRAHLLTLPKSTEIVTGWKGIPDNWEGFEDFSDDNFGLINVNDHPDYKNDESLYDITPGILDDIFNEIAQKVINNNLYDCLMWKYSKAQILPDKKIYQLLGKTQIFVFH